MADEKDMSAQDYNRQYYKANKEKILEARRKKYTDDPVYREKALQRSADRKRRLKQQNKKNKKNTKVKKTAPIIFAIEHDGLDHEVSMLTAGQLAEALGRKTQTIRVWEKKGIIPQAMYRSDANDRLYTELQVKLLKKAYLEAVKVDSLRKVENRISLTIFPQLARDIWTEHPLGFIPE